MAENPNCTDAPIDAFAQLTSTSSTSTPTSVYTGPAASSTSTGGAKVGVFKAISTDTTQAIALAVYKTISSMDYLVGFVSIPQASGATLPAIVDILDELWGDIMNLGAGTTIKVMPAVAPASGKIVNIQLEGATF